MSVSINIDEFQSWVDIFEEIEKQQQRNALAGADAKGHEVHKHQRR